MQLTPNFGNLNKYCVFHWDTGDDMDECRHSYDFFEGLFCFEKLKKFIDLRRGLDKALV